MAAKRPSLDWQKRHLSSKSGERQGENGMEEMNTCAK